MNVFEIRDGFGFDHLVAGERPLPEPGHGEVRLKMKAASFNYRDVLMIGGQYNPRQPLPLIPCSDGVGEVEAVGDGVRALEIGDRVATLFSQKWLSGAPDQEKLRATLGGPLDGTLAEYMVLPETGVIRVPDYLSDVEVATLPCAALTAYNALVVQGGVCAGKVILVQGTGGVALFALQLARALGARVILTSSSDAKLERAQKLGIWRGINYRDDPEWGKTARRMTDGRGVDHVIEVGGAGTLEQSLRAVRVGGQISLIGILAGTQSPINILPILMNQIRVQGIFVGSREAFEDMNRVFDQHQIQPIVDRIFPFDEAREAVLYMSGGRHMGKVCVQM